MTVYAAETYGRIAELQYVYQSGWVFDTLGAHCDIAFGVGSPATAWIPQGGNEFVIAIRWQLNPDSSWVHTDGQAFMSANAISQQAAAVIFYPEVRFIRVFDSTAFTIDAETPGELVPQLEGSIWISANALAIKPNVGLWHTMVIAHEAYHLISRVTHDEESEATWFEFINPMAQPGDARRVWDGKDGSSTVNEQVQWTNSEQMAPIAIDSAGIVRSQCEELRADPANYLN